MKKRLLTALAVMMLALMPGLAYANSAPNIVYILADDMGQGDTSAYNAKSKIATPNLDRLAAQGMKFTNVHSNSSVCTPTRYGIMTGRYAWRTKKKTGVLQGHSSHLINQQRETTASLLQKNGYATAVVGKWHLGMDWADTDGKPIKAKGKNVDVDKPITNGPTSNGFDYYFGISASLNMNPHSYIENDQLQGDMVFLKDNKAVKAAGLVGAKPGWMSKGFKQDQVQKTFIDKTIAWIEMQQKADPNKPFFVYLPLNSPHSPIVPSQAFLNRSGLSKHGDFIMEMDHQIGRLLSALEEMKLSDDTLVIFTADNGTSPAAKLSSMQVQGHYSSMDYRGLKGSLYEGGHRVPFIARWPGVIKTNSVSDYHASLVDLLATVADISDVKLDAATAEDSVSMLQVFKGKAIDDSQRGIVYHSDSGYFSIRQGQWKLILHNDGGSRRHNPKDKNNPVSNPAELQLFDMLNDPTERNNVQAQHPETVTQLIKLLETTIKKGRSTEGAPQPYLSADKKINNKWQKLLGPHIAL